MADVSISYKNTEIATMDATGVKTLLTGDCFCEDDITVSYTKPSVGVTVEEKDVNFIDYDGTIVYSYTAQEFANLTALPPNPTHDGLTAQGWNWTKAQIAAQLTAAPNERVYVGQMYITTSGASEIDITLDDQNYLSPYLVLNINGTISVDWGDTSTPSTVTGSSIYSTIYTLHEYAATGKYTIKISVLNGSYTFYNNSIARTGVLSAYNSDTIRENDRRYSKAISAIRLGSVEKIGPAAFRNCCALQSITIPSNITALGSGVFYGCYNLQSITIPSGVTSIGNQLFYYCPALQSITIPSSVTSIVDSAFYGCASLQSITIPSGVTSIGSNVFYNCYALQSITIPSGVTSISSSTFYNCYDLQNITIPSSVTSIGSSAFYGCHNLQNVIIPSGVTSIGSYVFYNCYALQSITIPSSVTSIGNSAFRYCYSLQNITIPSSVTSIGTYAFSECYGTIQYHFQRLTPPTLGSNVFYDIVSGTIIYVPSASLDTYKTATNWSSYASYMQGE